ncbi:FecR family protein [Prevotella sp.]|uniref:FecR family protein n=1 Tax=Prevotella sp. TaxID=59823 RepID=UPI002F92C0C7
MDKQSAYHIIRLFTDRLIARRHWSRVARWITSHEDEEAKEAALKAVWDEPAAEDSARLSQALEQFRARRDAYEDDLKAKKLRRRIMKYAALFVLPLAMGASVWLLASSYYARSSEMMQCNVGNGTTDSLLLSDGTRVKLNAGSTIFYPKSFNSYASKREVYLEGEAHFEVSKDADHPFIVHTGNLSIKVLGTHFNVKAYPNDETITTTLEEGRVQVAGMNHSEVLEPNEQLLYNRFSGKMRKLLVDSDKYKAWINGDLNFEQAPLRNVLRELGRKYNVEFNVSPSVDMNRTYTMSFKNDERIDEVMTVISKIAGNLVFHHKQQSITLSTKKGGRR